MQDAQLGTPNPLYREEGKADKNTNLVRSRGVDPDIGSDHRDVP